MVIKISEKLTRKFSIKDGGTCKILEKIMFNKMILLVLLSWSFDSGSCYIILERSIPHQTLAVLDDVYFDADAPYIAIEKREAHVQNTNIGAI